jgi:hypothetical protein
MKNKEIDFYLRVLLNGLILAAAFFVSVWAVNDLTFLLCKSILIFFMTYILAEIIRHRGIETPTSQSKTTLIFN